MTTQGSLFREPPVLVRVGDPTETLWYAKGRPATRDEVDASIESGLPLLRAEEEGPDAVAELKRLVSVAQRYLPPGDAP